MEQRRRLSDQEVHQRLVKSSEELERLADGAWSVAGATALRAVARMVRVLSSGFFMGIGKNERREG